MSDKKILKHYSEVIFQLKDMLQDDVTVTVTDLKTHIMYRKGDRLVFPIQEGTSINKDDQLIQAVLKTGEKQMVPHVPKQVYGVPFKGYAYPIKNKKDVLIGAIGIGMSLEKNETLEKVLSQNVLDMTSLHSSFLEGLAYSKTISQDAQDISAATQEIYASIEEITSTADDVENTGLDAKKLSDDIKNKIHDGNESLEKITESVEKTAALTETVTHQIEKLKTSMKQIDNMVAMINQISEQTNLLALNASIEAARAGEHGRGFAVVADEVSKLAEQSKNATNEIVEIVRHIGLDIDEAVNSVKTTNTLGKESVLVSKEATAKITSVLSNIENLGGFINKISENGVMQKQMTAQISKGIESLADSTMTITTNSAELNNFIAEEVKTIEKVKNDINNVKENILKY